MSGADAQADQHEGPPRHRTTRRRLHWPTDTILRLLRSKWANPFKIGRDGTRAEVISKYCDHLLSAPELMAALPELRGKDLACWCSPEPCHGEVLLELANS